MPEMASKSKRTYEVNPFGIAGYVG